MDHIKTKTSVNSKGNKRDHRMEDKLANYMPNKTLIA